MIDSRVLLGIDTSGPSAYVALEDKTGTLLSEKKSISPMSHSEDLSSLVQSCFDESKRKFSNLENIIVGNGPGSFTGLRIGLSYAVGLASGLGSKVTPISSSHGAAIEFVDPNTLVVVLGDARREEVFVSAFFSTDKVIEDEIWRVSDINVKALEQQKNVKASRIVFVSQDDILGVNTVLPLHIARGLLAVLRSSPSLPAYQGASFLGKIEPNYVRKASAKTLKERQISTI